MSQESTSADFDQAPAAAERPAESGGQEMSQGRVEMVRAICDRWDAGDHSVPTETLDPAVEFETPLSSVSGEPYRGHAGIEQLLRDIDEQFAEWRFRIDDAREVGNAVLAIGVVHGGGRASSIPSSSRPRPCSTSGAMVGSHTHASIQMSLRHSKP
jgi:ketosteroid isomerase-like protein